MAYAVAYAITAILTALVVYVRQRLIVLEAVSLMGKQRYRTQYKQDDQLATQKQVAAFIERWK